MFLDRNTPKHFKAFLGRGSNNSYDPLAGVNGQLRTVSKPFGYEVAAGNIPNLTEITKFGHNSVVAATLEEVWDGSEAYVYMTTASTLYISSSNTNDDQVYEVQGLDADWRTQKINVTANGFNFVALAGTWIRVFRVKNIGTTDNAGTIYISDSNTDIGENGIPDDLDDVKAQIIVGLNQTLMAIWSSAFDVNSFLVSFYASTSSRAATEIHLSVRPFGGVFQIKKIITIFEGTAIIDYNFPLKIPAKSDVAVTAQVSGGGGDVSAGFDIWCEPNTIEAI